MMYINNFIINNNKTLSFATNRKSPKAGVIRTTSKIDSKNKNKNPLVPETKKFLNDGMESCNKANDFCKTTLGSELVLLDLLSHGATQFDRLPPMSTLSATNESSNSRQVSFLCIL
jgi:hypothetical protein